MSQLVDYARTSTAAQNPVSQLDALKAAGYERVFTETSCANRKVVKIQKNGPCLPTRWCRTKSQKILCVAKEL